MIEHLKRCFETQSFAWSEIEPGHSLFKFFLGNGLEVRFLGKILSKQSIRVFMGAALPRGLGMGEVKIESKCFSDLFGVSELFTVIGSQSMHFVLDRQ